MKGLRWFQRAPLAAAEPGPAEPGSELEELRNDLTRAQLELEIAVQLAKRRDRHIVEIERRYTAELAENKRLIEFLAHRGDDPGTAGPPPVGSDDVAYWRAEAARHRANATRLEDRLAAAEGRRVYTASIPAAWAR